MKNPILITNPMCKDSREFKEYLDSIGFKYCLLSWYSDNNNPKGAEEAIRLVVMHLTGALENVPLAPPEPEIEYTDEDIENQNFPNEHQRWIMGNCCKEHAGKGYIGPNLSSLPSIVYELDSGELGIWECHPERNAGEKFLISDLTPEKMRESVVPGFNLAGQTIESAMQCASSPYWGNHIMRTAVKNHIKRFNTISIAEREKELVRIRDKSSRSHNA
jgi:hypothetical protein